ncbi:HlyD family type I secretion periplasmic adaptor subunit [Euhalothece natronophila Z-M001]|uniref:HlyD family type I secretion periplasmic adaptor subunit n=1 Tax=Euhalothece natronophila Z-M001 TaxID=522448 RepID=A0A5B8NJX0_9CHRO|nr:HlyD family type I secretion periplasmic adaptor subunit [Euhalothece natronophila]QDZ39344.1 HlyD family type I secretion periplasmic adaptor subunit [Euhalothece natronophila Z-M001]
MSSKTSSHSALPTPKKEAKTNTSAISVSAPTALAQDTTTWSPSVQSLLEKPPASLPIRLILGGLVFGIAVASWAWWGQIEEVGNAQGKLVPQGRTYKIQPSTNGRITDLLITEGDTVTAEQVLAILDSEQHQQRINQLEDKLASYETQLQQQSNLLMITTLEATNRLQIANSEIQGQEIAIAGEEEKINNNYRLLEQLNSEITSHEQRIERLQPLQEVGAISQEYIFQAEQLLQDSKIKSLRAESDLDTSKTSLARLKTERMQKQQQKDTVQLETEEKIQQLEISIQDLQGKILETQNELRLAQITQQETVLVAPVSGTVLSVNLQNVGQVVQPGETIAEIAPQEAPLILDAILPVEEAGFIEEDMTVNIKFDAYPYQDYGVINGRVIDIAPNSRAEENIGSFYEVKIALEQNYITNNQRKIQFQPGQTANAEIIIRRRRIIDVIFDPLKQLQEGGLNL